MSDPTTLLLSELGVADDAETDDLTATTEQVDDPTSDLLAALGDDDSPEDDASSDELEADAGDVDEEESVETLRQQLARLETERDEAKQLANTEAQQRQQDQQLQLMRQAQAEWEREEAGVIQQANSKENWNDALGTIVSYYRNKLTLQGQAAQKLLADAYSSNYLTEIGKTTGLPDEDVALLQGIDPKAQATVAKALAAKNAKLAAEIASIKGDLKQLQRGRQSQRRAMTGADRLSGGRGATPPQKIVDGSIDQAYVLFQAGKQLKDARRRG